MKDVLERVKRIAASDKIGKIIFGAVVAVSATAFAMPRSGVTASSHQTTTTAAGTPGDVRVSATLSQSKLVQGADGTFYVEVAIDPPAAKKTQASRTPVDMVVVLDRSGSMSSDNRLPYAKSAINELLSRLNPEDRFGLITFETGAEVVSPLTTVTPEFRAKEQAVVDSITTAGSTNLSGGLELAKSMLQSASTGRVRKVVLMSDGEANVGMTDPHQLAELAHSFSQTETIISTIGLGLGFNEVLMSSLADHGMGNYSYLENLASLGNILQKDLTDSRTVYASSSALEITLPPTFKLLDSSGYPQEGSGASGSIRLLTGQLLEGVKKSFFLTLSASTDAVGEFPLGAMRFNYTADGKASSVSIDGTKLALAVVEPSREAEAVASVDDAVMKKSWIMNNLGKIQRQVSDELRRGNAPGAQAAIVNYRKDVAQAEAKYKIQLSDGAWEKQTAEMESTVADVAGSSGAAKDEKGNRAAKAMQKMGLEGQRAH